MSKRTKRETKPTETANAPAPTSPALPAENESLLDNLTEDGTLNLSLLEIESDMAMMISSREELLELQADLENGKIPATSQDLELRRKHVADQLAFVEQAIREYAVAEIAKVDKIAGLWRYYEYCLEIAKREARLAARRSKSWETRLEYLKSVVKYALGTVKKDKIETPRNWVRVQKNSAPQVVVEMGKEGGVPDRYLRATAVLPLDLWKDFLAALTPQERETVAFKSEFNLEKMARDLGNGVEIPGASLVTGTHVRCSK